MSKQRPGTFIKVDRGILDWRWFHDAGTLQLWLYILLRANVTDNDFEGITVHRGELVTSLSSLAAHTGLTIRQVRTALGHLKSTGEVTCTRYPKYSVIRAVHYSLYQDKPAGNAAGGRQATGKPAADERQQYKKEKESKNEKEGEEPIPDGGRLKTLEGSLGKGVVRLSDRQMDDLLERLTLEEFDYYIARLADFILEKSAHVKSHYRTILKWVAEDRATEDAL